MWVPWWVCNGAVLIQEAGSAASHQAGEGSRVGLSKQILEGFVQEHG